MPAPAGREGLVSIEWHGVVVGVWSTDEAVLARIRGELPPGARLCAPAETAALYRWTVDGPDARGGMLHVISRQCAHHPRPRTFTRTGTLDRALARLIHDAEFRVAIHAPERLFIHAAAVAWEGRVIVLPGHSRAGKTTLAAALVQAGALYFSDEYAVIDEAGLVHPFPRRLHMRSPEGGPSTEVPVEELGGVPGTRPLPIGMIVSTHFRAGARWRPRVMSAGTAALALFDNAIVARIRPEHTMSRIARALEHGIVAISGPRGEAEDAARRLLARATRSFD